jgi:hypothetical protein
VEQRIMPALNLPAGSAAPLPARASVSDEAGMTDRRRWTSFLTWAFVLAEMAGRDAFLPSAAHAGDDDAGRSAHALGDTAPIVNNLPNVGISIASDGPETVNYQHASLANFPAATAVSGDLAEAKVVPVAAVLAHGEGSAGGGADFHTGSVALAEGGDGTGVHLGLGEPGLAAFSHTGETLDVGINLSANGLVGDLGEDLGHLPIVGGHLDGGGMTGTTVGGALPVLEPLVSIVGGGNNTHHAQGSSTPVGLPGQLNFASDASPGSSDDLTTQGGYTNYGITLHLDVPGVTQSSDIGVHGEVLGSSGLDHLLMDHLPGSDLHIASDALHFDQALLRTASDILV